MSDPKALLTVKSSDAEVAAWLEGVADAADGEPNNDAWNLRVAATRLRNQRGGADGLA